MKLINKCYFLKSLKSLVLIFSLLLVFLYGCRTSKEIVRKPTKQDIELLNDLVLIEPSYRTVNSKMEFKVYPKEGVSAGMKGSLKICRDSCLILSLQPFAGIEMVRCLVRPDSFFVVSRIHSSYSAESIESLPFSEFKLYNLIESVLTNRVFIPGKSKPDNGDIEKFLSYKGKEGSYFSITQDSLTLSFHVDEEQQYDQLSVSTENVLKALEVNYSMFERTSAGVYPRFINMQIERSGKKQKATILFLEPSYDRTTDFKFVISPKYKKVPLDELVNKFSNML